MYNFKSASLEFRDSFMARKKKLIPHLSDEEILIQIRDNHDTSLFGLLYEKYNSKVTDKCYSLLKNIELAEEFTQEIFFKVFEKLNDFKGASSFSTWLYAITYNHCIEYLRNKKKLNYPEWNQSQPIPDIVDDVDENTELSEIKYSRLLEIFEKIHPEEKALLLMRYQDDMPTIYIQEALKISESAAKMRIKRAKARVAFLYKELYPNE